MMCCIPSEEKGENNILIPFEWPSFGGNLELRFETQVTRDSKGYRGVYLWGLELLWWTRILIVRIYFMTWCQTRLQQSTGASRSIKSSVCLDTQTLEQRNPLQLFQ